jgi:HAD superfamily hydrolase (TIGR01509 family)
MGEWLMAIHTVLFDFGGVIAEEGFRNGLTHIAQANSLDAADLFKEAQALILSSGYLTGHGREASFWEQLKARTGIKGRDEELKAMILQRFILRDWMMKLVKRLSEASVRVAILSDQTNWLDELDSKLHFFNRFERIFNSYHLGKSKNDPGLFSEVIAAMGIRPSEALFIDDTIGHVERARSRGLHAICYTGKQQFLDEMKRFFPGVEFF